MESKKTIVLGASPNSSRYSYIAVNRLKIYNHEVIPVGIKKGYINGLEIINHLKIIENVDTITLYIGPKNQLDYYDYIIKTNPKRVIFNPGTVNLELMNLCENNGIEVADACTLVMLAAKTY